MSADFMQSGHRDFGSNWGCILHLSAPLPGCMCGTCFDRSAAPLLHSRITVYGSVPDGANHDRAVRLDVGDLAKSLQQHKARSFG